MTAVAKLPAKWREEAADHDRHKDPLPASILRECADELEAALSPAELGGVELDEAERRSRDQRAMGWDAVCNLLFELRPEWTHGAGTGIELAVATIRAALTAAPQPAQAGASGGGEVAELVAAAEGLLEEDSVWDDDLEEEVSESAKARNNHVRAYQRLKSAVARFTTPASPATGKVTGEMICEALGIPFGYAVRIVEVECDEPNVHRERGRWLSHIPTAAQKITGALAGATPQPAAAHPELPSAQGWLDSHCAVATTEWMRGWDAARSALAAAAPRPQEDEKARRPCPRCDTCNDLIVIGYCRDCARTVADAAEDTPPAHGDGERAWQRIETAESEFLTNLADKGGLAPIVAGMLRHCARLLTTRPAPEAQEARDAARYRWLRDSKDLDGPQITTWDKTIGEPMYPSPTLADSLIDAALALPAQGEG